MQGTSFNTEGSAGPVRAALDEANLLAYLQRTASAALPPSPRLSVRQFAHGQSNPTYLLTLTAGEGGQQAGGVSKLVLRKKPPGVILASAHAVEREYQVISALHAQRSVPVPRPIVLCQDERVLGTPFYVMQFAEGTIFLDPNLPQLPPDRRAHLYREMASTLSKLHLTSPSGAGLASFGSASNYCRRQVRRWSQQYRASISPAAPEVLQLVSWLESHIPADDASPASPAICHGDYRLDNLVVDTANGDKVVAVLDWELSTVGNAWADLAYNCLPYHLPAAAKLPRLQQPLPQGVPTEEQYVSWYCSARGLPPPSKQDWAFYLALSLFRLLAILAGVQARARMGNASSAHAAAVASDEVLHALAAAALDIIHRSTSSPRPGAPVIVAQAPASASSAPCNVSSSSSSGSSAAGSASAGGFFVEGLSPRVQQLRTDLLTFMEQYVYPSESAFEEHAAGTDRWTVLPLMEELKAKAKAQGLWNLWLPASLAAKVSHLVQHCHDPLDRQVLLGPGLNNLEYAHLCEITGRSPWAPEVFNCGAPDTGNMEVLAKYGTKEQQVQWLLPLLRGEIRSCFAMTEKAVASSDATNIQASIKREGDGYRINGIKWWTSGACDPRCNICIFMGKTDTSAPLHKQQTMVLVPMNTPGVKVVRPMLVYGYDDAPHGHAEVHFNNVTVPVSNLVYGEGTGFEVAQGRLGPGRLHHCMRLIGMAERAIEDMAKRALQRNVFGGPLAKQGAYQSELAKARIDIDSARLLVLAAAAALDAHGFKGAKGAIAAAKVSAPNAALRVIDAAVQVHGGAGVSQDFMLARLWTHARTLRIADGPDEVHLGTLARLELGKHRSAARSKL